MSKVIKEFSRFAHQYNHYNSIQMQVAKRLVSLIPQEHYVSILDMGCGSGQVYKNLENRAISFDSMTVLDSSKEMLTEHPQRENITKVCANFNTDDFITALDQQFYDLLLSSSALQWSEDLDLTLSAIASLSQHAYFAIFTSGTFKTLHQTAEIRSPIYDAKTLQEKILKYYATAAFELHSYRLEFNSVRDMFRYIKKSGVSAGEKKLSYTQTKLLMENYPLTYLEFEVLFVKAKNL